MANFVDSLYTKYNPGQARVLVKTRKNQNMQFSAILKSGHGIHFSLFLRGQSQRGCGLVDNQRMPPSMAAHSNIQISFKDPVLD